MDGSVPWQWCGRVSNPPLRDASARILRRWRLTTTLLVHNIVGMTTERQMVEGVAGVTFWTDDVERLAGFYRDVLELPVHSVRPEFVAFDLGGVRLNVGLHSHVAGRAEDPLRVMVNLGVADIHRVHETLAARGVDFIRRPEQEHWGGWVATFSDPDGNVLQLLQQPR